DPVVQSKAINTVANTDVELIKKGGQMRDVLVKALNTDAGKIKTMLGNATEEQGKKLQSMLGELSKQVSAAKNRGGALTPNEQDVSTMVANIRAAVVPIPVIEANWKTFLSDLLKCELWPLRELFGSELTSILNEAQISTAGWPQFHVLLRPLTFSGAANEVA